MTGVSIHAPAWGATLIALAIAFQIVAFQSTRPRGARLNVLAHRQAQLQVSIHAPAWGATPASWRHNNTYAGFNPRARVGRDLPIPALSAHVARFNPRARVGRDLIHQ